jgi:hypothetical protein
METTFKKYVNYTYNETRMQTRGVGYGNVIKYVSNKNNVWEKYSNAKNNSIQLENEDILFDNFDDNIVINIDAEYRIGVNERIYLTKTCMDGGYYKYVHYYLFDDICFNIVTGYILRSSIEFDNTILYNKIMAAKKENLVEVIYKKNNIKILHNGYLFQRKDKNTGYVYDSKNKRIYKSKILNWLTGQKNRIIKK